MGSVKRNPAPHGGPSTAYTVRWDDNVAQYALLLYGEPIEHSDDAEELEGLAYEYNRGLT